MTTTTMPDLSICETDELKERMVQLLDDLDGKLKDVGPIMEKIGRLRQEISVIADELDRREGVGE